MTVKTLSGMTTDVYPRENCIAPAILLIVWTTDTKNGCGLAPDTLRPQSDYPLRRERLREASHTGRRDTGEMGVGRDGRVIDQFATTG